LIFIYQKSTLLFLVYIKRKKPQVENPAYFDVPTFAQTKGILVDNRNNKYILKNDKQ